MPFDLSKMPSNYPENYFFDLKIAHNENYSIIGIDEAGRGALAGPVVIAGLIPDYSDPIVGITDSKKLTPSKREKLFEQIISNKNYKFHIAVIDVEVIDSINILNATKKGMMECLEILYDYYTIAIIDAVNLKIKDKQIYPIIKADLKSASVGGASILAKVTRDRIITELSSIYSNYELDKNKGYPTKSHIEALKKFGASEIHRKSYAPVKETLKENIQQELNF